MPDVWRVRGAPAFAALARPHNHDGSRRRSGPVTITWVPPHTGIVGAPRSRTDATDSASSARGERDVGATPPAPAAAFAISRRVGSAVVRNRLRRRLRAELSQLTRRGLLRPGCYLIALRPEAATTPAPALRAHLAAALGIAVTGEASR